jgi:hypothetical protein
MQLGNYRGAIKTILERNHYFFKKLPKEDSIPKDKYNWEFIKGYKRVYRLKAIKYENGKKIKRKATLLSSYDFVERGGDVDKLDDFILKHGFSKPNDSMYTTLSFMQQVGKFRLTNVFKQAVHTEPAYIEKVLKPYSNNKQYSIDKAPISLFIHSQDSTVKDVVLDFFLRAKQGELITNHDSYSPHGQFAFTFFDVYIEAFKDIMKDEKHLAKFIEAFNMLKENYENQELMKILEQRSPQLEIMDILHIPNEFWINLIWKST